MDFLSRDKSPSFIYRHGQARMINAAGDVTQAARLPAVIKFEKAAEPYTTQRLAGKDGLALGRLFVSKVLEEFRIRGHVDVEAQDVIDFLCNHPGHNRDFVFVGNDADPFAVEWIVDEPDGKDLYCKLCDKHNISRRGRVGHQNSHVHQDLLKAEMAAAAEMVAHGQAQTDAKPGFVPDVSG